MSPRYAVERVVVNGTVVWAVTTAAGWMSVFNTKRQAVAAQASLQAEYDSVAWDRAEDEACERCTPGCSVRHTSSDSSCQTW